MVLFYSTLWGSDTIQKVMENIINAQPFQFVLRIILLFLILSSRQSRLSLSQLVFAYTQNICV